MLVGKTSLDYTNLFSPKGYKKKGKKYITTLKTDMAKGNTDSEKIKKWMKKKIYIRSNKA